jgi:hypothetical protein
MLLLRGLVLFFLLIVLPWQLVVFIFQVLFIVEGFTTFLFNFFIIEFCFLSIVHLNFVIRDVF